MTSKFGAKNYIYGCVIIFCQENISIVMNGFYGEVGRGSGRNRLDFSGDPDSVVDPGSFSMILCHQQTGHKLIFSNVFQQIINGF